MSGRNPSSYCTLTLIAMQGHKQKGRQNNTPSNNKDKSNTIIETSTAEDHDDENLHNPSTRSRYSPGSRLASRVEWERCALSSPLSDMSPATSDCLDGALFFWGGFLFYSNYRVCVDFSGSFYFFKGFFLAMCTLSG